MTATQALVESKTKGAYVFRNWWMLQQNNTISNPAYQAVQEAAKHYGFTHPGYLMDFLEHSHDPAVFEKALYLLQQDSL